MIEAELPKIKEEQYLETVTEDLELGDINFQLSTKIPFNILAHLPQKNNNQMQQEIDEGEDTERQEMGKQGKILIVDDEPFIVAGINLFL